MPIARWTKEETLQANGGKHVVVRYYDGDEKEDMISFFASAGVDVDTIITARIPDMNERLAQNEFEALVGAA